MTNRQYRNWKAYWSEDNFWKNSCVFKINAEIFFRQANKVVEFKKDDTILNVGCGLGYLEILLSPKVKSICAVDIAGQFVDLCKKKCRDLNNITVNLIKDSSNSLSICEKHFSLILCISVVQYFKDMIELESFIKLLRNIALPGGRALIADIPRKRTVVGFVWDILCSLVLAIQRGYALSLFRTGIKKLMHDLCHGSLYGELKSLYFTKKELELLIQRTGLDARILQKDFSVYANRLSLLIRF